MSKVVKRAAPAERKAAPSTDPVSSGGQSRHTSSYSNVSAKASVSDRYSQQNQRQSQWCLEQDRRAAARNTSIKMAEKRKQLIAEKPDIFAVLKLMETNRQGEYFYDCK